MASDAALAALVALGVHELRFLALPGAPAPGLFGLPWAALLAWAVAWPVVLFLGGGYRLRARWSLAGQAAGVLRALIPMAALLFAALFLSRTDDLSRAYVLLLLPALGLATVAARALLHVVLAAARSAGRNTRFVVVAGTGAVADAFVRRIAVREVLGLRVIGFLADDATARVGDLPRLGALADLPEVLRRAVVDEVAICLGPGRRDLADHLAAIAQEEGKIVRVPLETPSPALGRVYLEELDGLPVMTLVRGPDHRIALAAKRAIDIAGALLGLVVCAPLLAGLALWIAATDGRPVLFRQERIGRHGRPFTLWKLRTMRADAEALYADLAPLSETEGPAFKIADDPRITRPGRFLRRTGLDELPQLWNVLRGEMSLVGPRPAPAREVDGYAGWHRRRLSVRPGITGLWQVTSRFDARFDDRARLDLDYIDRWSLRLDLEILARTVPVMLRQEGR